MDQYNNDNDGNPSYEQDGISSILPHLEEDKDSTNSKHILQKYADEINIMDCLRDDEKCVEKFHHLSMQVLSSIMEDTTSQAKWMMDVDDALRLAKLTKEPKNTPLPQSANIKYPLITTAAYQFAARTYPELIQDGKIVKTIIEGQSNPIFDMMAEGIQTHMSYQLLGANSDWETGMDKLLNVLPNVGFICKKTYYDSLKKQNISDICYYKDLILRNDASINCLNDLRRITHIIHCHPNDLIEGARSGIYDEDVVQEILATYSSKNNNQDCDLYEQHTYADLDDDMYEEPYIITVHKQTNKVIRILARYTKDDIEFNDNDEISRIQAIQYFTDYHFLPAPDGSFMSVGFGTLMLHLNETVNTLLNQLIDAGTLANMQTGLIDSRIKLMGGQMGVDPGQWTRVKAVTGQLIKEGVMPLNYKEPSTVLYQLLGLLLNAAKELTSSTDAMQGLQNATNVPATSMLAMVEQGLKMFSAIQRRLYRALKEEYQKLFRLNSLYLNEKEYLLILGPDYQQLPHIYQNKAIKVIPIADPNLSSDAQRLSQAQVIMQASQAPGSLINQYQAQKRMLEAAKVTNIDALLPKQAANQPKQPDPKLIDVTGKHQTKMAEIQIKGRGMDLKEKEFTAKLATMDAQITQMQANSAKLVSEAQANQHSSGMDEFHGKLQALKTQLDAMSKAHHQGIQANIATANVQQRQQEINNQHTQAMTQIASQHHQAVTSADQNQQEIDNAATPPTTQDSGQDTGQDNQGNDNGMESPPVNPSIGPQS